MKATKKQIEKIKLSKDRRQIALLIYCDNMNTKSLEGILRELKTYGDIIVKRAYGNFTSPLLKQWINVLNTYTITPIQQFDYTKGKNSTDMIMSIDAMELLYTKDIRTFAFMTSDCDFTPVVSRLINNGCVVFGFGKSKSQTTVAFKNACSLFIDVNDLVSTEDEEKEEDLEFSEFDFNELIQIYKKFEQKGEASLSQIALHLYEKYPHKKEKIKGKMKEIFGRHKEFEIFNKGLSIKLKK